MLISRMTTDFEADAQWEVALAAREQAELNALPAADQLKREADKLELLALDPFVELALGATEEEVDWKTWRSRHHSLQQQAARLRRQVNQLHARQTTRMATRSASRTRAPGRAQTRRRASTARSGRHSGGSDDGGSGGDSDPPPPTRLWAIPDVALYLYLSTYTVYTAHSRRTWHLIPPPSIYLGRHPRWRPADVEQWLDEHATTPTPHRGRPRKGSAA